MGDFFHGWRRKVGVLTLLLACVLMGGWIRSLTSFEGVAIPRGSGMVSVFGSLLGNLVWGRFDDASMNRIYWESSPLPKSAVQPLAFDQAYQVKWQFCGFGHAIRSVSTTIEAKYWFISYWSIVVPLTLLSAFLLLSNPPKATPKKTVEPIPEKVV